MKKLILILTALLIATFAVGALAEAAADYAPPAVVPAQSKEDFIGNWQLSGASIYDLLYLTAEEVGVSSELEVSDGVMTITFNEGSGTSPWELMEDGTLKYTDPDGSFGIFVLREDGTISTDTDTQIEDQTVTLTMYFARVPEA